ncbi:TIGR02391 family protein [Tumebacillus sp. ITR2]|uniref:TIGR02391 family protein n=1 Tax=Tumebacillus amylolyticus TaxID=2801339 RepID=A0ABS1J694_9BACL|nr:TIGR02391 family protein [Tumebacillus amylolyticus]MBL0385579.1 TIGR02391 family protein [Tumebacillus amylolyticus]
MNYRLIATHVGDLLKYDVSINVINRIAGALFAFQRDVFQNESITSERAKLIFDWALSLERQSINPEERDRLLFQFCLQMAPPDKVEEVQAIFARHDLGRNRNANEEDLNLFQSRSFHLEVVRHCQDLFVQGNYFHAVFEASKAYNLAVKTKANSGNDGYSLMMEVWGCPNGVLKLTECQTDTDRNVQEGIKFLSGGLMKAVRNPTAHEPAISWPIDRQDCLDNLSFISFLFRKLDASVYSP